jgi:putative ABC transport system ATP-binding protein
MSSAALLDRFQDQSFDPSAWAIVAHQVSKTFRTDADAVPALQHVDFQVPPASLQFLMGPSGSGKTTLLSILAGLMKPDRGQIYLLGEDVTKLSREKMARFRLRHLGFIFQDFNLFGALTAQENVSLSVELRGVPVLQARKQAQEMLIQVGLGDKLRRLPSELSGGQKQRVAIARALVGKPQILMADEPTASLDSRSGEQVMQLLRRAVTDLGCTVLVVTHDVRILREGDRIFELNDGLLTVKSEPS